jgi:hypothetical protein
MDLREIGCEVVDWIHQAKDKGPPVSIAERSKACTVYNCLNIEISGLNPAQGMNVCLCVSVLCCPVCQYRPCIGLILQPRESYQMSVN